MVTMREARKAKNLTQKELGCIIGKKPTAVSYYESGMREPRLETAKKIAAVLDVPLTDLIFSK